VKPRPNYAAGAAATVWLAVIGVPLYALISSAIQTQASYGAGGPLAAPGHFTGGNFVTVVESGFLRDI
jgi:xylobiose transport system permease protein